MPSNSTRSRSRALTRLLILGGVIVLAILAAWALGYFEITRRENIIETIRHTEGTAWAAPLYVLAYTLVVTLGLPTTVFCILGGALFGTAKGFVFAWTGALTGTMAAHSLARSIGKGAVRRLFGGHKLASELRDHADLRTLVRLRVIPLFPFGVLAYVAGLGGVPLRSMLLATAIAVVPGLFAYAYAGDRLRVGLEQPGPAGQRALVVAGLVTVVVGGMALVPWIISRVRARARASAGGNT